MVSSTGREEADLLVGWGCVKNSAIVFMWLVVWRRGKVEVPLHEVRMCVVVGLAKHRWEGPLFLSMLHRKGRSER